MLTESLCITYLSETTHLTYLDTSSEATSSCKARSITNTDR